MVFRQMSSGWRIVAIAGLVMLAAAIDAAQRAGAAGPQPEASPGESRGLRDGLPGPAKPTQRAREGSLLTDESGSFEFVGDRIVFVPAGSRDSYRVLENLALERIVRELGDGREQRNWVVSGLLTEYRGSNYLLVTKTLITTQASSPVLRPDKPQPAKPAETSGEVANSAVLR